jgi:hypothetical protein
MAHLVNRLQFQVNCPDEDQAFGIRHNFAQTLQLQIAAVIDKVCTQYVPKDEWLQIDTLEVDIGQLSPQAFSNDFEQIFLYRFEKELLAKLSGISADQRNGSAHQSMLALLQYFLLTGTLPWWADENDIELDEVCNDVFKHSEKQLVQFFLQQKDNATAWKRASFQLSNAIQSQIILLIEPFAVAKKELAGLLAEIIKELTVLQHVQKEAVLTILQQQVITVNALILEKAPSIFAAAGNDTALRNIAAATVTRSFLTNPAALELVQKVLSYMPGGIPMTPKDQQEQDAGMATVPVVQSDTEAASSSNDNNIVPVIKNDGYSEAAEEIIAEKMAVKQAGIILLAPFFKPFFTKLQLLESEQWVNREAQVKAVYLLKYLADGGQQYPEYKLILEKLLCGMTIHEPLEAAPVLLQNETNEADELLQSVLEHWKQLKNTSANGLRESFFKRDGIISPKENNWLLQVERKTVDVLLDGIPWGYSTVTLPWNEYIIFTEW